MSTPMVKVDMREPATLTTELTYLEYEVENLYLNAGDFEGKYVIGEIKRNGTNNDFFQSIVDRRIFNQPKKMLQKKKKPFILVAGDPADTRWRLKPVIGALLTLILDFQMQVITIPNNERIIAYTIHKIMEKDTYKIVAPLKLETMQMYSRTYGTSLRRNTGVEMLRSIPRIGSKTAQLILKVYPSIAELVGATEKELQAIPGVGPKSAQTIYQSLRGEY